MSISKPKALIICGVGINCEDETVFAFNRVGFETVLVHLNDFIKNVKKMLDNVQVLAMPGGFAYADSFGAGVLVAGKIKYLYSNVFEEISCFIEKGNLAIGICNGCQILSNLFFQNSVRLLPNYGKKYICRWEECTVEPDNNSIWLRGIHNIILPIAHGEGRFDCSTQFLKEMRENNMVSLKYVDNPNGSVDSIAAISDKTGRVFLSMPHPERAMFFSHRPDFCIRKEELKRANKEIPNDGDGIKIFLNAFEYFV